MSVSSTTLCNGEDLVYGNCTRAGTLADQTRKEWRFTLTYEPVTLTWTVHSVNEGWTQVVRPSYLRGIPPTAQNVAIQAVFHMGETK